MILIIDNYDSFTYNLVQYVGQMGYVPLVVRNNKITIIDIIELNPNKIIISPGPGFPDNSGISLEIVKELGPKIPILGVCLGHQVIGQVYGAKIVQSTDPMHGKVSKIYHDNQCPLFKNVPNPFIATRYHSLIIEKTKLPNSLNICAYTKEELIMSIQHKVYSSVYGIQFHPESIRTDSGKMILKNFLAIN
nr:trpG [Porphyropsis coccinea]